MKVSANHPDEGNPLLAVIARFLEAHGADLWLDPAGENLARGPGSGIVPRIEAQGFPNVVHELVHFLFCGRIDDDHGFDYGGVPYDLTTGLGRTMLAQELAACVVSCAYMSGNEREMQAWFDEQISIQPVFFGHEREPLIFAAQVDHSLAAARDEMDRWVASAYALVGDALMRGGADPQRVRPSYPWTLELLWQGRACLRP